MACQAATALLVAHRFPAIAAAAISQTMCVRVCGAVLVVLLGPRTTPRQAIDFPPRLRFSPCRIVVCSHRLPPRCVCVQRPLAQ